MSVQSQQSQRKESVVLVPNTKTLFVIEAPYKDEDCGYSNEVVFVMTERQDLLPKDVLEAFLEQRSKIFCRINHDSADFASALVQHELGELTLTIKVTREPCPYRKYSIMEC